MDNKKFEEYITNDLDRIRNRLSNGDFNVLSLEVAYINGKFVYILEALRACSKFFNKELFYMIVIYADFLLLNCKCEDGKYKEYVEILESAIDIACTQSDYYECVEQLFSSRNEEIRLYSYTKLYLNKNARELLRTEENHKILKVVELRDTFKLIWETTIEGIVKERILWFEKMLEMESFYLSDRFFSRFEEEPIMAVITIRSILLENDITIKIDRDILWRIRDRRMIAYFFNQMYENGELRFKEGVRLPECFELNKLNKHTKVRRRVPFKSIDNSFDFNELFELVD